MLRAALLTAVAACLLAVAPASATCMDTFNDPKTGIRSGTCAAPGGPVSSYFCVRDTCVWT